jgi:membrane fusion protein, multidrug efflux system
MTMAIPSASQPARRLSTRARILWTAGLILAFFVAWEAVTSVVAYTDDAYVRSDLVAFAPQVTGHIVTVNVVDNQPVHKSDLLATIDPVPFQLAVDDRKAALAAANALVQADGD